MKEKIYRYTYERLREGDPPSIREVQRAMGLKAVESARAHLEALVSEGRLRKRKSHSRSYALPLGEERKSRRVPILGQVQAGALTYAEQDVEGFVEVEGVDSSAEVFALKVRGLSMKDAGILPGDLVITRRQATAQSGDIVVALLEDEATVKTFRKKGKKIVLQAENPDFESIEVTSDELQILGKVIELRRSYEES